MEQLPGRLEALPPMVQRHYALAQDHLRCLCGHLFVGHAVGGPDAEHMGIGLGVCGGGPGQDACDKRCQRFRLDHSGSDPVCTAGHGPLQLAGADMLGGRYQCHTEGCHVVVLVPSVLMAEVFEHKRATTLGMRVGYYATIKRDSRTCLAAGPFDSEAQARDLLPRVREVAEDVDSWTAFDAFGTCRAVMVKLPDGKLNGQLGIEVPR